MQQKNKKGNKYQLQNVGNESLFQKQQKPLSTKKRNKTKTFVTRRTKCIDQKRCQKSTIAVDVSILHLPQETYQNGMLL